MGIPTYNVFFNEEFIDKTDTDGKARLINAAGVFFHLEELHSVCKAIKRMLAPNGVFVVQFMYLVDIIKHKAFDAIYHEHLCYYTLESLENLLKPYDLRIFDAYESPIHGGSMIAKVCHKEATYKNTMNYVTVAEIEATFNPNYTRLLQFAGEVEQLKLEIMGLLQKIKGDGNLIYGYGSPAKGTTMLTYCGIGTNFLDYLVEINDLKVGLRSPGTNIPIIHEETVGKPHGHKRPDYYFVLAWNFWKEIHSKFHIKKLMADGTKFILPLPKVQVYP